MAMKPHLLMMLEYSNWANRNVMRACATVCGSVIDFFTLDHLIDQLCFRSIHGVFNHIIMGMRMWRLRMTGAEYQQHAPLWKTEYAKPGDEHNQWETVFASREDVCRELLAEDQAWFELVQSMSDEDLFKSFHCVRSDGTPHEYERAPIISHVVNHSTHHRGQISAALSALGARPPLVDLPYYIEEKKKYEQATGKSWSLQPLE